MKKLMTSIRYKLPMLTLLLLAGVYSFAQDASGSSSQSSSSHTTITTTGPDSTASTMWYSSPWVWVIGGVVLLIILIAAFSGKNKSTNEVTRTTRVTTEVKND